MGLGTRRRYGLGPCIGGRVYRMGTFECPKCSFRESFHAAARPWAQFAFRPWRSPIHRGTFRLVPRVPPGRRSVLRWRPPSHPRRFHSVPLGRCSVVPRGATLTGGVQYVVAKRRRRRGCLCLGCRVDNAFSMFDSMRILLNLMICISYGDHVKLIPSGPKTDAEVKGSSCLGWLCISFRNAKTGMPTKQ